MRTIFTIFIAFLVQSASHADADEVLQLLKRDFEEAIEVHGALEIWYCPDNTCELYKIASPHPDLSTFVYLHLFYESGYTYLNESIGGYKAFRKVAKEEPSVTARASHYCKDSITSPECILKGMKSSLGISVGFGRYDEGNFCYEYENGKGVCQKL